MSYKVSIIIPTYNRGKPLETTIKSFMLQSFNKENYEIIIVDNNSSDLTKRIVENLINANKNGVKIKYIFEPRQGVHFARNTASKIAEGEILYFTDDDMKADGGLLEEIIKVFDKEKDIGAVTGLILPIFEVNPPKWILENCYNSILSLTEPTREKKEIISYESMGVFSCHYAILKNVFVRAGGFNPENTAGLWIGNGELGLNIKIKKLKLKFVFLPKSIIYHIIPKERLIQKYINKRLANQGAVDSYTAYQAKKYNNFQLYVKILYYILRMPYCLLFLLINFITGNSKWRIRWAFIFYYIRRIKYDFKLIINSDWKKLVLKENWLD